MDNELTKLKVKMKLLLIKPWEPIVPCIVQPPLGILYLASACRTRCSDLLDVEILDAKCLKLSVEEYSDRLADADIVGISAFNYELPEVGRIAALAKRLDENKLIMVGGPCTSSNCQQILAENETIDWAFDGEAEISLPVAIAAWSHGEISNKIPGRWFRRDGKIFGPDEAVSRPDVNELGLPAWDMVRFEDYKAGESPNRCLKGTRYAPIFSSRGCPYSCAYCHNIFGKKFRPRTAENVVAEIRTLHREFGVDEIHIEDDIFNLDRKRMAAVFELLARDPGVGKLHFCFPNAMRGDLLDEESIDILARGGTFQISVAVETVTPRLQKLISKNQDIEKVKRAIDLAANRGLMVESFFMVGFPTETPREIFATLSYAIRSRLTSTGFFLVVPQPRTELYEMAKAKDPKALERAESYGYHTSKSWYELSTGFPLNRVKNLALILFYFTSPRRAWKLAANIGLKGIANGVKTLLSIVFRGGNP